jgi:hypothetical protein
MKIIIPAIILSLFGIGIISAEGGSREMDPIFFLLLNLTQTETSKDENWQNTFLEVRDRKVEYSYHYGGYPDEESKTRRYRLSKKDLETLIGYIHDHQLNRNIKEIQPADGIGIAIDLKLEIKINNTKTSAVIAGRSNIWASDSSHNTTNIENLDFYEDTRTFLHFLNNEFGFDIVM